jgi:hypothetical protein
MMNLSIVYMPGHAAGLVATYRASRTATPAPVACYGWRSRRADGLPAGPPLSAPSVLQPHKLFKPRFDRGKAPETSRLLNLR